MTFPHPAPAPESYGADIAIVGGSGLYDAGLLENVKEVKPYTPFGKPSDTILVGEYKGKKIAFLARHGRGHQIPPHLVNYRANIWALKELGVKRILASSACGSLREDFRPGDLVILDQFIDRTKSRAGTFYEGGKVCHVSTAEPFCSELRAVLSRQASALGLQSHFAGTYICIEGPRFSTRAESRLFRSWGADAVGMTLVPEAVLAREAEICYASVALVTDYDVWAQRPVSMEEVLKTMKENVHRAKSLFSSALENLPAERNCGCGSALKDATV